MPKFNSSALYDIVLNPNRTELSWRGAKRFDSECIKTRPCHFYDQLLPIEQETKIKLNSVHLKRIHISTWDLMMQVVLIYSLLTCARQNNVSYSLKVHAYSSSVAV